MLESVRFLGGFSYNAGTETTQEIKNNILALLAKLMIENYTVSLKQIYLHIHRNEISEIQVDYALRIMVSFKKPLPEPFSTGEVSLSVWNVSPDSKIYKKMHIKKIDEWLKSNEQLHSYMESKNAMEGYLTPILEVKEFVRHFKGKEKYLYE